MYYKKLMNIFHEQENTGSVNSDHVNLLAEFIESKKNHKYLNPYEFSSSYKIPLKITLTLFSIFSNEGGILEPEYFFECSNTNCSNERIFLNQQQLKSSDDPEWEPILCEECSKEFSIEDIISYVKLYFIVNFNLLNRSTDFDLIKDPNSTIDCLGGLPLSLKSDSLLSSGNKNNILDRGDKSVQLINVVEAIEEIAPSFRSKISKKFRDLASYNHE